MIARLVLLLWLGFMSVMGNDLDEVRSNSIETMAINVPASQYFEGNDGPWSTFEILVGEPPQNIRVLPSTLFTSTLVVLPQACSNSTACADSRGGLFNFSASTSWKKDSIYNLYVEENLGYYSNGQYGFDTVSLGYQGGGGPLLNDTVIAGIANELFWLGHLGLNPRPTNFSASGSSTDLNNQYSSLLTVAYNQGLIPSLSYSYTTGNQYRLNKVVGSLVLGGFDQSRFAPNNVSFAFGTDDTRDLIVGLQTISINTTSGNKDLLVDGILMLIDSTLPYIWLPEDVCEQFEDALGLTYDEISELYLINDTIHLQLLKDNPTFNFKIGTSTTSLEVVTISFPYAAFDLTAEPPLVSSKAQYFPIKRASNETQFTLGRSFLQEAYISVDYTGGYFSVSQCIWSMDKIQDIQAIHPQDNHNQFNYSSGGGVTGQSSLSTSSRHSLDTGGVAGIIVGAILFSLTIFALLFLCQRRIRGIKQKRAVAEAENGENFSDSRIPEMEDSPLHPYEKDATTVCLKEALDSRELEGSQVPILEMEVPQSLYEIEGKVQIPELDSGTDLLGWKQSHSVYELPGSLASKDEKGA